MFMIMLKTIGLMVAGAAFTVVTAHAATRPTRTEQQKDDYDISDVEIVECPGCGISTFAGTERCPVCSRSF
jgi:hypothetical protein